VATISGAKDYISKMRGLKTTIKIVREARRRTLTIEPRRQRRQQAIIPATEERKKSLDVMATDEKVVESSSRRPTGKMHIRRRITTKCIHVHSFAEQLEGALGLDNF
jgi:hypothetical protein